MLMLFQDYSLIVQNSTFVPLIFQQSIFGILDNWWIRTFSAGLGRCGQELYLFIVLIKNNEEEEEDPQIIITCYYEERNVQI